MLVAEDLGEGPLARLISFIKLQLKGYVRVSCYLKPPDVMDARSISDSYLHIFLTQDIASLVLGSGSFRPLGVGLIPIITQNYEGDITILADLRPSDLLDLLTNPSKEAFIQYIHRGGLSCDLVAFVDGCYFLM